jgi:hypothetical protein
MTNRSKKRWHIKNSRTMVSLLQLIEMEIVVAYRS